MNGSGRIGQRRRPVAVFRWLALLATLPVAVLSVFRAVPAEWPVLVVQLLSFTPWLALPTAAALLLAFLGRSRWQQAAAVVLAACQTFWLFPMDAPRPVAAPPVTAARLTVMNLNSEFGQADAGQIVALVRNKGVELLVLQEFTQDLQDRLSTAGLDGLLRHRISEPANNAGGAALYSRYSLEPAGHLPDTRFKMPTVRLTVDDGAVGVLEVTSVHAFPPVDSSADQWRSDLSAVGRAAERPGNRLLTGDFNATYDHSEFREILAGGHGRDGEPAELVDVGAASGSRLLPTWPMEGHLLPGIAIDHLVTSPGVGSSGYAVHRVSGTDHAAVLATLAIPAD